MLAMLFTNSGEDPTTAPKHNIRWWTALQTFSTGLCQLTLTPVMLKKHRDQPMGSYGVWSEMRVDMMAGLLSACSSWIFREGMLGSVALFISRMPILRAACCDSWRSFPCLTLTKRLNYYVHQLFVYIFLWNREWEFLLHAALFHNESGCQTPKRTKTILKS